MRALLLAAVLTAACADDRNRDLTRTITLTPGERAEAEYTLRAGDELSFSYDADALVTWDVHVHDGDAVEVLIEETATSQTWTHTATRDGTHWLSLRAEGDAAVTIDVTVSEEAFEGW